MISFSQLDLSSVRLYFVYGSEEQVELLLLGRLIWTCYQAKKSNCILLVLGLKATNVKLYAIIPLVRTVNWFLVALDQRVLHKIVLQGAKCLNAAQTKQIKVIVLASIGNFTISSTIK